LTIRLRITDAGRDAWNGIPDPLAAIRQIAFDGADTAELETARRVLQAATERLDDHLARRSGS
jgi:MarR family transcriptional regulator, lower aerobic nicotinate degradation pathway regulator